AATAPPAPRSPSRGWATWCGRCWGASSTGSARASRWRWTEASSSARSRTRSPPRAAADPSPLLVGEAAVQVVVVGGEVEEAVAAEVEQDHPLLARLLRGERLVDRGPDGVRRLRRRDLALGAGELHGRLEHLPLR